VPVAHACRLERWFDREASVYSNCESALSVEERYTESHPLKRGPGQQCQPDRPPGLNIPRTKELPVAIFSTRSGLISPGAFLRQLVEDLVRSRHMVWAILKRDLTSQYRQSVLGFLLPVLPALATTLWAILFRNANLINVGRTSVPYPFFVFCGMMIWAAFLEAIDAPIQGVLCEQGLLSKSSVPAEAVTFARLGQVFLNFLVKAVVVAIAAVTYRIHVPWIAALTPIGVAFILALGAAIGLILAPFNLLYRDVSRSLSVVTTLWFFLTPVIFVSPGPGLASVIIEKINPVTQILIATRDLIFPGSGGSWIGAAAAAVFAIVIFCAGLIFHRIAMPIVLDRANS
jgi:lipopolysaccharide transport system permease protein